MREKLRVEAGGSVLRAVKEDEIHKKDYSSMRLKRESGKEESYELTRRMSRQTTHG